MEKRSSVIWLTQMHGLDPGAQRLRLSECELPRD